MEIRPINNNAVQSGPRPGEKPAHATESPVVSRPAAPAVAVSAAAVQQPGSIPNLDQVSQAVKSINKNLQERSQNLEFTVDTDNDRTIVKVVDQNTKEILRQIPSEEALEIAKAIDQAIQGLLIKQQA